MDNIALTAQSRPTDLRARDLRRKKLIPAVVYGQGFENLHLQMDYQTFRRAFEKATYSTIVSLDVKGAKAVPVLVHDVQYHPVTDDIVHVDFYAVRMDKKVTTHIALEFVGASEAVKQGALLNINKHEVEVTCLPGDLVHSIEVDISPLVEVGDIIRIEDIVVPKGIEILDHADEPVVSAMELKVVEEVFEETPAAGVAATETPEGEEKGAEKKGEE
ncbi:MAG: 50S ribosomal protein L25 [bacterium]|nr:50S ribosomal protein L25 [bacterium]